MSELEAADRDDADETFKDDVDDTRQVHEDGRKGSAFYKHFHKICALILDEAQEYEETLIEDKLIGNKNYNKKYFNYMVDFILPYYPLWSAAILPKLNLLRYSNAPIENYFNIVKNRLMAKKLRIPIPRFLALIEGFVRGWILERQYTLRTERQRLGALKKIKDCKRTVKGLISTYPKSDGSRKKKVNVRELRI